MDYFCTNCHYPFSSVKEVAGSTNHICPNCETPFQHSAEEINEFHINESHIPSPALKIQSSEDSVTVKLPLLSSGGYVIIASLIFSWNILLWYLYATDNTNQDTLFPAIVFGGFLIGFTILMYMLKIELIMDREKVQLIKSIGGLHHIQQEKMSYLQSIEEKEEEEGQDHPIKKIRFLFRGGRMIKFGAQLKNKDRVWLAGKLKLIHSELSFPS